MGRRPWPCRRTAALLLPPTEDGAIWLWDLPSGTSRRLRGPRPHGIQHLVFSPDSRSLVSTSVIVRRDFALGRPIRPASRKAGDDDHGGLSSLLFTRDGKRLTAVRDRSGRHGLPFETL